MNISLIVSFYEHSPRYDYISARNPLARRMTSLKLDKNWCVPWISL